MRVVVVELQDKKKEFTMKPTWRFPSHAKAYSKA